MDFRSKVVGLLKSEVVLDNVDSLLTVAPKGLGDFAFPCFVLAKIQKKNPVQVASDVAKKLSEKETDFLEKIEAKGPYVNFFLKKEALSSVVLDNVFSKKIINKNEKGKIMIEYSSPNTNKPLHLGHLRNNVLGLALSNLLEEKGFSVVKVNLVNDRGVHICKSMLAYKLFGENKTPKSEKKKSDHFVGDMYVLFSEKQKNDPTLEEQAQEMLRLWEKGDKETIALWKQMNEWAISGMKETYKNYGTSFDEWLYESELYKSEEQTKTKIIQEGLEKGVFKKEDNGAIVAVLEPELPNKVLLRGDGTSLYATNDLVLTEYKFREFDLDKSIWVVANEQELYFKQLVSIFKKLGRKWAEQCYHLSYGYVSLTTGKMKSREGTVIDADDLLTETTTLIMNEFNKTKNKTNIDGKNSDDSNVVDGSKDDNNSSGSSGSSSDDNSSSRYSSLSVAEKEKRARLIALSAIKFYLLKNDAKKDMVVDPKQSISFEGETGPYVQYTFARAKSILRKAKSEKINYDLSGFDLLVHDKEKELISALGEFSVSVDKSWEQLSLHPLCHNLLSISEKFNSYYHEVPILKSDSIKLINARLALVEAVTIVLEKGLNILDIKALEEM
ncbi:MAG: arginine--tRNA ligase [Candidatus Diapherotrites archaeon]|uniref:Arginine--tRNA ligase n=1 Tax=Candidatus Iainarchaeum sp. TaxID=3101447 RepID=A0A7K4C022_9ARCH|nr:arginine--tRNA ligase [Candidatus Diapherotrites archaeon]